MPSCPLTSAQARAASAPPSRSPLLLGRGPGAATSWRLPLKQPGLGGLRSVARPGTRREGSALEGRGPATAPRPSSSRPAAHCRPRPFLADSPPLPGADPRPAPRLPRRAHFLSVGHPHFLHGSGPQRLGNLEMPDSEGWGARMVLWAATFSTVRVPQPVCFFLWWSLRQKAQIPSSQGFPSFSPHCCGAEVLYPSNTNVEIMSDLSWGGDLSYLGPRSSGTTALSLY